MTASRRPTHYRVHGLCIGSDFAFPELRGHELPPRNDARPDLMLRRCARRELPEPTSRQWSVHRVGSLSVAHGPWGAVFESYCGSRAWLPADTSAASAVLHIARARGIATDWFHHTVLHTFVPLALALRGHTLVHAACVAVEGRAFLYPGESRMGKSTLAAGFAERGLAVLSDDVVRVQVDAAGAIRVWPGYPGARLRSESFLLEAAHRSGRAGRYGLPRFRVHTQPPAGLPPEGVQVAGVCFLGRSRALDPRWERLSPLQAITPWVESCFLLSLPKPVRSRTAFECGGQLAGAAPAWRVSYRRSARHFPALCAQLVDRMAFIASQAHDTVAG